MPGRSTVGKLFEMAIEAEERLEKMYKRFADMFRHRSDVAAFWERYAEEEHGHAEWLKRIRDKQPQEQLDQPADSTMLEYARKALGAKLEKRVKGIKNLEDAYQLASDVENSETNAVFEFLITHFPFDSKTHVFLRAQLKKHIARLMYEFRPQFGDAPTCMQIKAKR